MPRKPAEQPMTPLTDEQLDRIRQTVASTVEEWRNDYGVPECKEYRQLVNRLVAATEAMRQSGVLTINQVPGRAESEAK